MLKTEGEKRRYIRPRINKKLLTEIGLAALSSVLSAVAINVGLSTQVLYQDESSNSTNFRQQIVSNCSGSCAALDPDQMLSCASCVGSGDPSTSNSSAPIEK